MSSDEATAAVIDAFERLGVPYMVVGALSVNFHAIPRSTKDADFVVQLGEHSIHAIAQGAGPCAQKDRR